MNFYPFHIGDYASRTKGLSLMEDLALRLLLDVYYMTERPLNGSLKDIARLIGMRDQEADVGYVLKVFFETSDEGYRNKRADKEIETYQAMKEKNSRAGKASALTRSNGRSTGVEQMINVCSTDVQPTSNQEPLTNNQEPALKDVSPKGDMSTPDGDRRPPVPHEKIIELYHEALPAAPRVMSKLWNGTRKKHLQARWNEDVARQTTDWWRKFFLWASYSSFLTGNVKPSSGRDTPFMADLGWIICPANFVKIYEGKYHDLGEKAQYHREHGGAK